MDVFGKNSDLLPRLMAATSLRSKVIAGNIANQNTPGYTRSVVRFEDLLREAATRGDRSLDGIEPVVIEDTVTAAGPDGNNVFLELELNALRENRLLYETYAAVMGGHLDLLRTSIQGGR